MALQFSRRPPLETLGISYNSSRDFNGDGLTDLLVASRLEPDYEYNPTFSLPYNVSANASVIFGRSGVGAGGTLDVASLDGNRH